MCAVRSKLLLAAAALLVAASGCGGDDGKVAAGSEQASPVTTTRTAPSASTLQDQLVRVVKAVSPTVVQIETDAGLGSGVVYDRKGNIVTNAHVVGNARKLVVTLSGGGRHSATLVGSFPAGDLAVVHVEGVTPRPATFADSSKIEVGDIVLAIGNPLGLRSSVTGRIVSSLGRTVPEGGGVAIPSAIQTSAPINPGNSGGALVDLDGRVIGIPTLAALDPAMGSAIAPGIGFAIPSNTAKSIADQLIEHGRVVASGRAALGVRVSSIVGGGVLVASVEPGSAADKGGIRSGDIIVAVKKQPTPTTDVLASVLATLKPGQQVPVELVRSNGRRITVDVTLGQLRSG